MNPFDYKTQGSGYGSLGDIWGGFGDYQQAMKRNEQQQQLYDQQLLEGEAWADRMERERHQYEQSISPKNFLMKGFKPLGDWRMDWMKNNPIPTIGDAPVKPPDFYYQKNVENPLYQELSGYHHAYGLPFAKRMAQRTKYTGGLGGQAPKPFSATNY